MNACFCLTGKLIASGGLSVDRVHDVGLYAEALHRRGAYDPSSPEASQLRKALVAAADETRTIVAAAAFRALDDLAAFDPHVDARRLDSRLVACAADASASSAARVMAVQLCGERKISGLPLWSRESGSIPPVALPHAERDRFDLSSPRAH